MGSPLFAGTLAYTDEVAIARLRSAGAIIIGKTNTPEFGLGSHSINPVFGATCNPYDPSRSAGGSSGGAGVGLATSMLSVADGSDMMGSLRNPAGWNNVYGMRPSWGMVPSDPVGDTFLHQLATNGPMARNPRDLAALLDTMAGPDPRQPHGVAQAPTLPQIEGGAQGQRIGWLADWGGAWPFEPGILTLCETALGIFSDLGADVEILSPPFERDARWESWTRLRSLAIAAALQPLRDDAKRAMVRLARQLDGQGQKEYSDRVRRFGRSDDDNRMLQVLAELGEIGDERSLEVIIQHLDATTDEQLRARITAVLEDIDLPAASEKLRNLVFNDPSIKVQRTALHALTHHESASVTPTLMSVLDDQGRDPELRSDALEYLGELEPAGLIDLLTEAIRGTDDRLAMTAFDELSDREDRQALNVLVALLGEVPHQRRRLSIVDEMEDFEMPEAATALLKVAQSDPAPRVRRAATETRLPCAAPPSGLFGS